MPFLTPSFAPTKTPLIDEQRYITDLWSAYFDRLQASVTQTPTGTLAMYAGETAPVDWLLCQGQQVSRLQFVKLFQAIGTRYGVGDGSTTFNLPNMADRVAIGASSSAELGSTGGSDSVLIAIDNLPNAPISVDDPGHTHVFTGDPHTHNVPVSATGVAPLAGTAAVTSGGSIATSATVAGGTNADSDTGITATLEGGGDPINILPPYVKINFIIKA